MSISLFPAPFLLVSLLWAFLPYVIFTRFRDVWIPTAWQPSHHSSHLEGIEEVFSSLSRIFLGMKRSWPALNTYHFIGSFCSSKKIHVYAYIYMYSYRNKIYSKFIVHLMYKYWATARVLKDLSFSYKWNDGHSLIFVWCTTRWQVSLNVSCIKDYKIRKSAVRYQVHVTSSRRFNPAFQLNPSSVCLTDLNGGRWEY